MSDVDVCDVELVREILDGAARGLGLPGVLRYMRALGKHQRREVYAVALMAPHEGMDAFINENGYSFTIILMRSQDAQ